jgi:hypothetical protein
LIRATRKTEHTPDRIGKPYLWLVVPKFELAVALHFMHYDFARIPKTLRITPAMADGISDHVWSNEEIAALAQ